MQYLAKRLVSFGVISSQVTVLETNLEKPLPLSCQDSHLCRQEHCHKQTCRIWPLALSLSSALGWKISKHGYQQAIQSFAEIKILSQYDLLHILKIEISPVAALKALFFFFPSEKITVEVQAMHIIAYMFVAYGCAI